MGALKVVVVGCGGISNLWFKALQGYLDATIVGLVDLHETAAISRKNQYRLTNARTGNDVEAMLKELQPDIVFDCTIPEARASVVTAALKHGCHVLSEKPMAASMDEARRLIEASQKAGRMFAVMQNRRFDPCIRAFRKFLATGAVGPLTTLNGDFYLGAHFEGFRVKMRHLLLLDMAIHSFDQARVISGADPVAIYCHEWNPAGSPYEHGTSAVAVFEMTGGIVYTYRGSWCAEGVNTTWECDWRAVGTRGSVTWDGGDQFRAQIVAKEEGFIRPMKDLTVPSPGLSPKEDDHFNCIRDFIQCVQTNRVPETICTENVKSLAMVFGAIESAEVGRRVEIRI